MIDIKEIEDYSKICGTSSHDYYIPATKNELNSILWKGDEENTDFPKVLIEWRGELVGDNVEIPFTIYDWKTWEIHGRDYGEGERIYWHLGTKTKEESEIVFREIIRRLVEFRGK